MSEPIKEQLSAFLDNELPKPELELLLKRLGSDEELRSSLERYVLIGEALRAAPSQHLSQATPSFSARVRAAVDEETRQKPLPVRAPRWSKPLTGFAVAAGAAAGAVLMVRLAPLDSLNLSAKENARPQTELARNVVVPAPQALAVGDDVGNEKRHWRTVPAVSATQLTHYVVAHSEYSSPLERRNVLTGVLGEAQPVNDVVEIEPESER